LASKAAQAPPRVVNLLDRAGVAEGIRTFRNSAVFLLADEDAKDAMRDRVRASLAVTAIVDEPKRLAQFTPDVQKRLRAANGTAAKRSVCQHQGRCRALLARSLRTTSARPDAPSRRAARWGQERRVGLLRRSRGTRLDGRGRAARRRDFR